MNERERMENAWTAYYDSLVATEAEYGGISAADFNAGYLAGLKRGYEVVADMSDALGQDIAAIIEELSRDG